MTTSDFLIKLQDTLMSKTQLSINTPLDSLPELDSMGKVSVISLLDEVGIQPPSGSLDKCFIVGDIVNLAGNKLS